MSKRVDKEMHQEDFEDIIRAFDMKCKYVIREIKGKNVIIETWLSESNPFLSLNRVFNINDDLSPIEPNRRKKLLNRILNKEVESENYEQAAVIRDLISKIQIQT